MCEREGGRERERKKERERGEGEIVGERMGDSHLTDDSVEKM